MRSWDYCFLKVMIPLNKVSHSWGGWCVILLLQFTTFGGNLMLTLWDPYLVVGVLFQLSPVHRWMIRRFLETQTTSSKCSFSNWRMLFTKSFQSSLQKINWKKVGFFVNSIKMKIKQVLIFSSFLSSINI